MIAGLDIGTNLTKATSDGEKVIHVQPITDRGLVRSKLKRAKEFFKKTKEIEGVDNG